MINDKALRERDNYKINGSSAHKYTLFRRIHSRYAVIHPMLG